MLFAALQESAHVLWHISEVTGRADDVRSLGQFRRRPKLAELPRLTQWGRRDWFCAAAGRFQPLREHLSSSHEKSSLIASPNRGRRVAPEKSADR